MPKVPHKDFGRRFRRFRNFRIFLLNRYQIWDCVQEIGFGHRIHQNPHKESLIKNPIRILVDKVSKKFGHLGSCAWNMRFGCSDLTHAPRNGKMGVPVVKPLKVPHKECRKYPTRILGMLGNLKAPYLLNYLKVKMKMFIMMMMMEMLRNCIRNDIRM